MNTTEPEITALAKRHTADMAHLPERDQQAYEKWAKGEALR